MITRIDSVTQSMHIKTLKIKGKKLKLRMVYHSVSDTGKRGKKEIRVLLSGVEPMTFRLLISDALPLSYRRVVGAKAIKLGSCKKTSCVLLGFECRGVAYAQYRRNVMVYVNPGE